MSIRAAAVAAAFVALVAPRAEAAGLFDTLFGSGLAAPRPAAAAVMPAPPPGLYPAGSALTITVTPPGMEQSFSSTGSGKTYCVRTCDGRFFPVAATAGNAAELCRALCPAAETKVFSAPGGDMAAGTARDGSRYTKLPNAFAYRSGTPEGCSCQHGGGVGLSRIDVMKDPTLRPGDIVMTDEGPMAFRGSKRKTYSEADFSAANLPMSPAAPARTGAVRTAQAGGGVVR